MHLIRAKYKIDRACGVNLWGRPKSPFNRRSSRPGQHGSRRRRKLSNYALQLMAKQKFRGYYGMKEGQFRRFFTNAVKQKGDTGMNLVKMLERRLDSVVYRLKWSATIFGSKQLVNHGHILVNGKKVDIPSYLVSPGDDIQLKVKAASLGVVRHAMQLNERDIPQYIETVGTEGTQGKLIKLPDDISEVPYACVMELPLVIEMYSRSI